MSVTTLTSKRRVTVARLPTLTAILGGAVVALIGAVVWWNPGWPGIGFTEYSAPEPSDIPTAIAVAPDRTVWFTIENSSRLGLLHDGRVDSVERGPSSIEPFGLAVDRAGYLWYTDPQSRAIARRSSTGDVVRFPLLSPGFKLGRLAVARDGAVWYADGDLNAIVRLKDGVSTAFELPTPGARPFGVAVAPDGTIWATLQRVSKLARIDPGGAVVEIDTLSRGAEPIDVTVDGTGAVWITQLRANRIARLADGRFTELSPPTAQAGLAAIAAAPDGAIWFSELRAAKLGRARDGAVTEFALPRPDARPIGIAVDLENNVWYADLKGKIGRLAAERARR